MDFKAGDIVRYIKTADTSWGHNAKKSNESLRKRNKRFIGNICMIKDVSGDSYKVREIELMPKSAWYNEEEFELVTSISELIKG